MKNVIVTGANGFIGSATVKELLNNDIDVYAIVRDKNTSNLPNHSKLHVYSCELNKISSLVDTLPKDVSFDIFYHFAWSGSAGQERANTRLQLDNAQWTIDCIHVAKELKCDRVVCAGSIMEYETMAAAYKQDNRPGLGYIYGGGKVISHIMSMSVANQIGIELIFGEITNAYGVGEFSPRLVNSTIRKIIKGESPQFTSGIQNYDFVYITDVARAFYLIGKNGKPFNSYLIGSSNAKPLKEFFLEMKKSIAPDLEFIFGDVPFTGVDLPLEKFDCTHTYKDTGFKAEISFFDGVKKTMDWLKLQEDK